MRDSPQAISNDDSNDDSAMEISADDFYQSPVTTASSDSMESDDNGKSEPKRSSTLEYCEHEDEITNDHDYSDLSSLPDLGFDLGPRIGAST